MTNNEIMNLAKKFMNTNKILFAEPIEFGDKNGVEQEVVFMNPLTLEPGAVVDPPDIRVWVNTKTKEVTLAFQL